MGRVLPTTVRGIRRLGRGWAELRDDEEDGVASALADGDDLAEVDDEDGLAASTLVRGKTSSMTVAWLPTRQVRNWMDGLTSTEMDRLRRMRRSPMVWR